MFLALSESEMVAACGGAVTQDCKTWKADGGTYIDCGSFGKAWVRD